MEQEWLSPMTSHAFWNDVTRCPYNILFLQICIRLICGEKGCNVWTSKRQHFVLNWCNTSKTWEEGKHCTLFYFHSGFSNLSHGPSHLIEGLSTIIFCHGFISCCDLWFYLKFPDVCGYLLMDLLLGLLHSETRRLCFPTPNAIANSLKCIMINWSSFFISESQQKS